MNKILMTGLALAAACLAGSAAAAQTGSSAAGGSSGGPGTAGGPAASSSQIGAGAQTGVVAPNANGTGLGGTAPSGTGLGVTPQSAMPSDMQNGAKVGAGSGTTVPQTNSTNCLAAGSTKPGAGAGAGSTVGVGTGPIIDDPSLDTRGAGSTSPDTTGAVSGNCR